MFRLAESRLTIFLLVIIFALLVSACGSTSQNTPPQNAPASTPPSANTSASPAANNSVTKAKVDLNTATSAEFLAAIPNLGNRMVHEFEEYRPYRSIQQFRKEIGKYVSQEQVAEYEKFVFVPIHVNQADAGTLQQIPGLDANEAGAMIAGRPYGSTADFLTKLTDKVSAADLEVARTYLTMQ